MGLTAIERVLAARRDLAESPGEANLASNLANALWVADQLADALSWGRWATGVVHCGSGDLNPLVWRCFAAILVDTGDYRLADLACRCADPLARDPACQFNRSKIAQGLGHFEQAWSLAESRFCLPNLPEGVLPGPHWHGWPRVSEVTIWSEQGLGDTIQFCRWLPDLLRQVPAVILQVQPPLVRLLSIALAWMGPRLRVEARQLTSTLSACHGSLLSLPWRLQQPHPPWPRPGAYLWVGADSAKKVPKVADCPIRIGLMWGAGCHRDGHLLEREYRRKSILGVPLAALLSGLMERPVELVRLQVGPDRDPPEVFGISWAEDLDPEADFLDLARLLLKVDLVITVDTAAAHLAGAMGRTAWVLLPWAAASRWGRHTSSTIWYPSLTLWRQPRHGDWQGLLPSVLGAVDCYVDALVRSRAKRLL